MKWLLIVLFIVSHDGAIEIEVLRFYTEIGCTKVKEYIKKALPKDKYYNKHRGGMSIISDCFEEK